MENIKLHKSDDLVSGIFKSRTSEVLEKILVLNIFQIPRKCSRKVLHYLKGCGAPVNGYFLVILTIRYCLSIIAAPLNPIGCSFEKIRLQKISIIKKKI